MHTVSPIGVVTPTILPVTVKGNAGNAQPGEALVLDLTKFHGGRWALQLDAAISARTEPVVLKAEGVACLAIAWWAKLSPKIYTRNIEGAIFESPLHVGFGQAHIAAAASVSPAIKLPFPSIVINSASPIIEQVLALADSWGSHFVDTDTEHLESSNRRGPATTAEDRLLLALERSRAQRASDTSPAAPIALGEDFFA